MASRFSVRGLLAALFIALGSAVVSAEDGWRSGRATFYGNDGGATIDQGSCMYGHLDAHKGTGLDIVALSDSNDDYQGSCGRCYEVQCVPSTFRDGYGTELQREDACTNPGKTVTVMVTDSCPCYYPANQYSNKRWCCGDMYHMDMSTQAFSKISDVKYGVVGMRFRRVSCPAGAPHGSPPGAKPGSEDSQE